jgi:hypothetical protein
VNRIGRRTFGAAPEAGIDKHLADGQLGAGTLRGLRVYLRAGSLPQHRPGQNNALTAFPRPIPGVNPVALTSPADFRPTPCRGR